MSVTENSWIFHPAQYTPLGQCTEVVSGGGLGLKLNLDFRLENCFKFCAEENV